MLKVEQGDRELAAAIYKHFAYIKPEMHESNRVLQMVAKHREDTALPLREENARLREALEAILKVRVEGWENIWAGSNRCRDIANAALHPDTTGGE